MTRAAFLRRWRADIARAEEAMLRDGVLAPLAVVVGRDGSTRLLPVNLRDDSTRASSVNTVRLAAVATDADLVLFRAEVWAVADALGLPEGVAPSASDRRVEAVAVAAMGRVGAGVERRLSLREILRDGEGRPTAFRDLAAAGGTAPGGGDRVGWMLDLLAPRRPSADERALAAALLAAMSART